MKSKFFRLQVELLEDLHSGSGTGNEIDALQKRDQQGHPVLRRSHVKGVLRHLAVELARLERVLEEGQRKAHPDAIERLFGRSGGRRRGALSFPSLRLEGAPRLLTWISTARQTESRIPEEDTLRNMEYVAAGSLFSTTLLLQEKEDEALEVLLKQCLKRMHRLGAQRTRGAGQLLVSPLNEMAGPSLPSGIQKPPKGLQAPCLRLLLRNLDPLCLPITGSPGNIIPSECYIRGQTLRGALASWLSEGKADDKRLASLFQHNSKGIHVTNAYPLPSGVSRDIPLEQWQVAPIPLYIYNTKPPGASSSTWPWWAEEKGSSSDHLGQKDEWNHFYVDALLQAKSEKRAGAQEQLSTLPKEKLKRPGKHTFLCQQEAGVWRRYQPALGIHMRNRVPESRSLPDKKAEAADEAALFSQEEIAEDTCFLAELHFSTMEDAEHFCKLLPSHPWLHIGRGGSPVQLEDAQWLETPSAALCWEPFLPSQQPTSLDSQKPKDVAPFVLLLTSDLIARSPRLAFFDALHPHMLCTLLGIEEEDKEWSFKAYSETVEVRGYNAVSQLPRAPALAIRRGSAIRIEGGPGMKTLWERLQSCCALGERNWEGFGRFVLLPEAIGRKKKETKSDESSTKAETGEQNLLKDDLVGQREALFIRAEDFSKKLLREKQDLPSRSQWQNLREELRHHSSPTGTTSVKEFLDALGQRAKNLGAQSWEWPVSLMEREWAAFRKEHPEGEQRFWLFLDLVARLQLLKKGEGT